MVHRSLLLRFDIQTTSIQTYIQQVKSKIKYLNKALKKQASVIRKSDRCTLHSAGDLGKKCLLRKNEGFRELVLNSKIFIEYYYIATSKSHYESQKNGKTPKCFIYEVFSNKC